MGSILRHHSDAAKALAPIPSQTAPPPYRLPTTHQILQKANHNAPSQKHQFNEYLLYENEFHGDTYVSCHLQRLQHALIDSPNVHGDRKHVTFVAIEFCFHPTFEHDHRFKNCVIEVTASRDTVGNKGECGKEMLRIIKYAPHLAFGRISSESLKWNFQLGAKLGVSQGPVDVSISPSGSYEKDKVVGTMMKIQGTTRSISTSDLPTQSITHHHPPSRSDLRDRKIVWSLEENDQQESGVPREFTFVFLVEQPHVHGGVVVGDLVVGDISTVFKDLTIGVKVKPSVTGLGLDGFDNSYQCTTIQGEVGQRFRSADEFQWQENQNQPELNLPSLPPVLSPTAIKDSTTAALKKSTAFMKKQLPSSANGQAATTNLSVTKPPNPTMGTPAPTVVDLASSTDGPATDAIVNVFKNNRSSSLAPEKQSQTLQLTRGKSYTSGTAVLSPNGEAVADPIEKKGRTLTGISEKSLAPDREPEKRLFNFALMEGDFEDLIELPGNAVTSMQPTLPEK